MTCQQCENQAGPTGLCADCFLSAPSDGGSLFKPFQAKGEPLDKNVRAVQELLAKRAAIGLAKYGVTTERGDLSRLDWLRHAQEEALDLAVYLQWLIADEEESDPYNSPQYQQFVESCVPQCRCSEGRRPCDGVLAGGMCDDIQDEDREERLEEEDDL